MTLINKALSGKDISANFLEKFIPFVRNHPLYEGHDYMEKENRILDSFKNYLNKTLVDGVISVKGNNFKKIYEDSDFALYLYVSMFLNEEPNER
jgi:hypothetical protein